MPIYEFTCKKCGHNFEELLTLSEVESGKLKCPACSSKRIDRGFSSFATGAAGGSSSSGFSGGGCGSSGFT